MNSSSDTAIHHRDVYGYFVALQKFFQDSEIKHDRSNSPRAQKARAKLLKLSASQFYELSTDVYDELQRRTNESRDQPEYLLPKASFHIKRNQARQKLANLSQTRFNDLVDDILYEIKRRGYDAIPEVNKSVHSGEYGSSDRGQGVNNSFNSASDDSVVHVPPTATIQASQVIPKKALIDWSSEEEEEQKEDDFSEPAADNLTKTKVVTTSDEDYGNKTPSVEFTPIDNSISDNYHYSDLNQSPAGTQEKRKNSFSEKDDTGLSGSAKSINLGTSIKDSNELQHEIDDLKMANDKLQSLVEEKETALEELKKENSLSKNRDSTTSFQKELTSLSSQVSALSIENETLKQQISELELKAKSIAPPKTSDGTKSLLDDLKNRYPLDEQSLTRFADGNGLITLDILRDLHEHVNAIFAHIQSEKEDIGRELFETLAHASNCIHQILILVDIPQFKDEVLLLKGSFSHAVTAVRYYSTYRSVLPRITVQAAISEVAFSICNLASSAKIKLEDVKGETKAAELFEKPKRESGLAPQTPVEPDSGSRFSQGLLQKPDTFTVSEDSKDEMSPVKPLKLTQKANMSPNANLKPSSARKTSGSLFFASMIDTKSPKSSLSSAHSSKINIKSPNVSTEGSIEDNVKPVLKLEVMKEKEQMPFDRTKQSRSEVSPITPTKSLNNTSIQVIDGTPSLPTPSAVAPMSVKKSPTVKSNVEPSDESLVRKPSDTNNSLVKESSNMATNKEEQSQNHDKPAEKEKPSESVLSNKSLEEEKPFELRSIDQQTGVRETSGKASVKSSGEEEDVSIENAKSKDGSPSRSFADKLRNFANGSGIGLRVEGKPSVKSLGPEMVGQKSVDPIQNRSEVETKSGAEDQKGNARTTLNKFNSSKTNSSPLNTEEVRNSPQSSVKDSKNYSSRHREANPTPSKLTERFKKAFEDISDNDSGDESKSDFNDSSNFSDDGSTYLALKQSMKKADPISDGPRTIQKATVYSPRAQQDSQFQDNETVAGFDSELSDGPSDSFVKNEDQIFDKPYQNVIPQSHNSMEAVPMTTNDGKEFSSKENDALSLNAVPFDEDLKAQKVKKEDLDESSEFQYVPLRKEVDAFTADKAKDFHQNVEEDNNLEDEREVDFDFDAFDIENPDNTLSELLLYLEHQTVQVISTIQSLLTSIKQPQATKGNLRGESNAINQVTRQMVDATSISMNQSRNASLKEHGTWVVKSLEDCSLRMITLCQLDREGKVTRISGDEDYADKHFKQRLAGIAFDVAKCTKELVKTVEEASLKEEIAFLNSRLN